MGLAETSGLALKAHLASDIERRYAHLEHHYGRLHEPWIGGVGQPLHKRLAYMISNCTAGALQNIDPQWTIGVDLPCEDSARPKRCAITLVRAGAVATVRLSIAAQTLKLSGRNVGKEQVTVYLGHGGRGVAEALADVCARFFSQEGERGTLAA